MKKYPGYQFSSDQNQLKGKSDVLYFKLLYIGNLSHHIKNKLSKLCKDFCKENFSINLVFNSFKIKNHLSYKEPIPNEFLNLPQYINLLVLAVVLAILAKLVAILKLGLGSISKMIKSLIFLNIYIPPQHALTHIVFFVLKGSIKLTLNST